MSNAAALRPEGGKQSGETSAQRRRERPNPGRLPAGCRRFCAGRGRNTGPVAQKGRRPPPKNPPKTPGKGQPRGKNALRQRARLWQCRLPPLAPMSWKDIPPLFFIRAQMASRMPQKEKG